MQIQVRTHSSLQYNPELTSSVRSVVQRHLSRFSARVTRVVVYLSDENGSKVSDDDKCCVIEARMEGREPSAFMQKAANVEQAVSAAAKKLRRALAGTTSRVRRH